MSQFVEEMNEAVDKYFANESADQIKLDIAQAEGVHPEFEANLKVWETQ